jgi:hypothetical protein
MKAARQQGLLGFGSSMLANSGWSTQRPSLGAALGQSVMAGSQMQQQAQQQALQQQLLKQKMNQTENPFGKINVGDFTPESLEAFTQSVRAGAPNYTLLRKANTDSGVATRERKIADAKSTLGMTDEEAVKYVDGYIDLTTDPLGNRVLVDTTNGSARLLQPTGAEPSPVTPPAPAVEPGDLAFDPGEGTGALAWAKSFYNKFPGQLPFMPVLQDVETAAQRLRYTQRDAVRALAISSRPPVIEQEGLKALVPSPLDFQQNPKAAQANMASFVDILGQQYAADMADSKNAMLPTQVRNEVARRANELQRIIRSVLNDRAADELLSHYTTPQQAPNGPQSQHPPEIQEIMNRWNPQGAK